MTIDWVADLLRFWFGLAKEQWWNGGPEVDEEIRRRFLDTWTEKSQLPVTPFLSTRSARSAQSSCSTRCRAASFVDTPTNMRPTISRLASRAAVERGFDEALEPRARLPLHAVPAQREPGGQKQSLQLFTALGDGEMRHYAKLHHDIVERFGRFPHRNAVLGASRGRRKLRRARWSLVMALVELAQFQTKVQADLARLLLEHADIHVVLFDEAINYVLGPFMPIRLMVREQDYGCGRNPHRRGAAREQVLDRREVDAGRGGSALDLPARNPSLLRAIAQASDERMPLRQKASSLPSSHASNASSIASASAGPIRG